MVFLPDFNFWGFSQKKSKKKNPTGLQIKNGRIRDWKDRHKENKNLENWKIGKLENWEIGKLENWRIGNLENWKIGTVLLINRLIDRITGSVNRLTAYHL